MLAAISIGISAGNVIGRISNKINAVIKTDSIFGTAPAIFENKKFPITQDDTRTKALIKISMELYKTRPAKLAKQLTTTMIIR